MAGSVADFLSLGCAVSMLFHGWVPMSTLGDLLGEGQTADSLLPFGCRGVGSLSGEGSRGRPIFLRGAPRKKGRKRIRGNPFLVIDDVVPLRGLSRIDGIPLNE